SPNRGSDLGGRGRPRESPFCSWENQSGCQRSEGVLEARRLTSLECPHDGALRFGERAYALGVGLLARRCELGQNTAAVLRIGTPADQAVLLQAIDQLGDVGAHAVLARGQIRQGEGFLRIRQKMEHRKLREGQSGRTQGRFEACLDRVRRAQEREHEGIGRRAARACSATLAPSLIMAHSLTAGHLAPTARYSCTAATSVSRSAWVWPSSVPIMPLCASCASS